MVATRTCREMETETATAVRWCCALFVHCTLQLFRFLFFSSFSPFFLFLPSPGMNPTLLLIVSILRYNTHRVTSYNVLSSAYYGY